MTRLLVRGIYLATIASVLSSCAADHRATQDAGTSFMSLETRFVTAEGSWLNADVALLSVTCRRIDALVGNTLRGNSDALDDYTARKKTCDELSDVRSNVERLRKQGVGNGAFKLNL